MARNFPARNINIYRIGQAKQGGILFLTNQCICLLFGAKPIRMRKFVLFPVKAPICIFRTNILS